MSARSDHSEKGHGGRRLAGMLRARWWVILTCALLASGVALILSYYILSPGYGTTTRVAYDEQSAAVVSKALSDAGTAALIKTLPNDALLLGTSSFAGRVSAQVGGATTAEDVLSSVTVSLVKGADALDIKATASEAELATDLANASAREFVKARTQELGDLLRAALDFVQGRIDSIVPAETDALTAAELGQLQYALQSVLSRNLADYEVLEEATVPERPEYPHLWLNLLCGLAAGLLLGFVLVVLMALTDRRVRDTATLERVMGLPVVGAIPAARARQEGTLAPLSDPKRKDSLLGPMATLQASLKTLGFGGSKRSLLVTRMGLGESEATVASSLALSMALAGERVILVDADLRNPAVHSYLGLPNTEGLAEVLADADAGWSEKIQVVDLSPFVDAALLPPASTDNEATPVAKFMCLTSGSTPDDIGETLRSPALSLLLADLKGYSDYVIVSGPPLADVTEALTLAQHVDSTILTTSLGKDTAAETNRVRGLLNTAGINAMGLVVLGIKPRHTEAYDIQLAAGEPDDELGSTLAPL